MVRGWYTTTLEQKLHLQAMNSSTQAASHYYAQFGHPSSSIPSTLDSPAEQSQPTARTSSSTSELSSSLPEPIILRLRSIEHGLEQNDLQDLATNTLVFCDPPTQDSGAMFLPIPDALLLQDVVLSNTAIINYERWLESAREQVEELQAVPRYQAKYLPYLKSLETV